MHSELQDHAVNPLRRARSKIACIARLRSFFASRTPWGVMRTKQSSRAMRLVAKGDFHGWLGWFGFLRFSELIFRGVKRILQHRYLLCARCQPGLAF